MAKILKIVITLLFTYSFLHSQNKNPSINSGQDIKFEHLSTKDGLSSGGVNTILQDQQGMMWFGTRTAGLVKYDGYNFTYYKNIPGDSTSVSSNDVYLLYEDRSGQIWIGTFGYGLCRFNRDTEKFTRYMPIKNDPSSISFPTIVSIFESDINNQNILWIGTATGLNKYIPESDNFKRYYPDENKEGLKSNVNFIYSIIQNSTGRLWIGTFNEGLYYFDINSDKFIRYKAKMKYSKLFKNKDLFSLCATREGEKDIIWMGTYVNGLYKIDVSGGQIKHFLPEPSYPNSTKRNSAFLIHPAGNTDGKVLWVVTYGDGICKFDIKSEEFIHFRHDPGNATSISSNSVGALMEDKNGILWIGLNEGVDKVNPLKSNFITFKPDANLQKGLKNGGITSFCASESEGKDVMWIGSKDGLFKYIRSKGTFTHFKHDPKNVFSLSSDFITSLIIPKYSQSEYLWIGTLNGLNRINPNTGRIKRFYLPNKEAVHNYILTLCEDETGKIWIGTQSSFFYSFNPLDESFTQSTQRLDLVICSFVDSYGNLWMGSLFGVKKYNINTKKITRYINKQDESNSISNNDIQSIFEDKNEDIWIGTAGGLNKYNREKETFICFTEKDGLPSDVISGILEDDMGNLWISTDKGISKFNPHTKIFKNFNSGDGLHGDVFSPGSAHKNKRGEMFFGGPKGFTMFHPNKIQENKNIPPIIISDFQIFNRSIQPGKNSIFDKKISDTREITLSHDQSVFSFEFAAIDYFNPPKNKYAYLMEGVDPEWVYTDASRRFATYTNLDPGDYTFRVKGSNNHGFWNETGTSIKVTILPPWWRTNLAYFTYILIIGFIIYLIWYYQIKRIRIKHQLEMEHRVAEQYQEIDRLKSHFFANISHEFRTPLTLILSPVEQLINDNFKGSIKNGYVSIRSNAKKLLRLVNQLLSLSKLEAGQMQLQVYWQDIVPVLKRIINLFSSLAERKKIDFNFTLPESLNMYFDEEKIETIINNLLSNAFKFTPEGGHIEVMITKAPTPFSPPRRGLKKFPSREGWPENRDGVGKNLQISISNTGPDIPKDQLHKIFDRFYQVESNNHVEGTGIGLSLTKELVELHSGSITVESTKKGKTTFTIFIPTDKKSYQPGEVLIKSELKELKPEIDIQNDESQNIEIDSSNQSAVSDLTSPTILIVEDNEEVRNYLRKNLENKYHILEAENGKIGIAKASTKLPDLIISDVMMPEMDGFEFCENIKNDILTCHIPVILLTARATKEDKLEGLKTGADDYLPKPFDLEELFVRIENLIQQRSGIRERFLKEALFGIEKITLHPTEQQFVEKVILVVNDHIENANYSVEDFAKDLGLSRAQLYRKIKSWTNQTPLELIRTCRLKKAAELLKSNTLNVTEASFAVGFKNTSHFINHFKKQFGKTPKEFMI